MTTNTQLPSSWATTTIRQVTIDRVPQEVPTGPETFTYVDISAVDRDLKKIVAPKLVPVNEAPSRARQRVVAGDVVVSMTRPNLNAVALVPAQLDGAIASTGFDVLRADGVEPRWLYYLVQSQQFVQTMSEVVQGVVYPAVRPNDIRNYHIPVAPLREQRRIADTVDAHFTRVETAVWGLQRLKANLKRYRASVLKAACEGRLVPTEAELARREGRDYEPADVLLERILAERRARWEADGLQKLEARGKTPKDDRWKQQYKEPQGPDVHGLPELPEGWLWASVDQLAEVIGGITKHRDRNKMPQRIPYLRVANVYANELRLDDVQKIGVKDSELERALLQPGDVLIVEGNGSIEQIGRVAKWDGSISPCVHQNHLIKVRMIEASLSDYAVYWLLSQAGRAHITRVASSTSGLYTLSLSKVKALPLPLPPAREIGRIVGEIERALSFVYAAAGAVDTQRVRSDRLRQCILKRAFEGRLVPQDASDEPASALLGRIRVEREDGGNKRRRSKQTELTLES